MDWRESGEDCSAEVVRRCEVDILIVSGTSILVSYISRIAVLQSHSGIFCFYLSLRCDVRLSNRELRLSRNQHATRARHPTKKPFASDKSQ